MIFKEGTLMKLFSLTLTALILIAFTAGAQTTWVEDFDSYAPGALAAQSDWDFWLDNPAYEAFVVASPARSLPHSVEIQGNVSDVIAVLSGATTGYWTISSWSFIPGNCTGEQWWILLNTYDLPAGLFNWSCHVFLDPLNGLVRDYDGAATLPLIFDQWVEVKAEIDLDNNLQTVYYNNQVLFHDSWTEHSGDGGGQLQIACLDLWGGGRGGLDTSGFWDDILIEGNYVVPTEQTSWGNVKSLFR